MWEGSKHEILVCIIYGWCRYVARMHQDSLSSACQCSHSFSNVGSPNESVSVYVSPPGVGFLLAFQWRLTRWGGIQCPGQDGGTYNTVELLANKAPCASRIGKAWTNWRPWQLKWLVWEMNLENLLENSQIFSNCAPRLGHVQHSVG